MNISKFKLSTTGAISFNCSQSRHVCVTKKRIAPKSRSVEMRHFCTFFSAPLSYTCYALYSLALQVSRNAPGLSELRHFLSALMLHFCALLWLSSIPLYIGRDRFTTTSHPLRWCVPSGAVNLRQSQAVSSDQLWWWNSSVAWRVSVLSRNYRWLSDNRPVYVAVSSL